MLDISPFCQCYYGHLGCLEFKPSPAASQKGCMGTTISASSSPFAYGLHIHAQLVSSRLTVFFFFPLKILLIWLLELSLCWKPSNMSLLWILSETGEMDGSIGRGTCVQNWRPKSDPSPPQGGRSQFPKYMSILKIHTDTDTHTTYTVGAGEEETSN